MPKTEHHDTKDNYADIDVEEMAGSALIEAVAKPEPPALISAVPKKPQPYDHLNRILGLAFNQAATGKGKERHANSTVGLRAWEDQTSMQDMRQIGPAAPSFQVSKKIKEAVGLAAEGSFDKAKADVLGAIVYAAKMYKLLEEIEASRR